jgi:hypothetical protein
LASRIDAITAHAWLLIAFIPNLLVDNKTA